MNPENNVIILQGQPKDRCSDIAKLENKHNGKLQVTFNDGMTYLYNQSSVAWYTTPKDIDLSKYYIYYNGEIVDNYLQVFNFDNIYYKFKFANGRYGTYLKKDLVFQKNCNEEDTVKSLLGYLKQVAIIVQDNDFLINQLESIDVKEGSVLYKYATATAPTETKDVFDVIYPFGSNKSQRQAINNAFKYDISVIQGPPGTGKTQTILNIIANAVIRGKTIAVTSNNNTATKNVQDKLEKYGFGFLTAFLGNTGNLDAFFKVEQTVTDSIKEWKLSNKDIDQRINEISVGIKTINSLQSYREREIELKKYIDELQVEKAINDAEYQLKEKNISIHLKSLHFTTERLLSLKAALDLLPEEKFKRFFTKVRFLFKFGIFNLPKFFPNRNDALDYLDNLYYDIKISELQKQLDSVKLFLQKNNVEAIENNIKELSLSIFRHSAFKSIENYSGFSFGRKDFRKNFNSFIKRYPIMLNTTQALLSSTGDNFIYDYVIIDESSQVALTTAVIAMSVAKNIVLVGDSMQLPHIVKTQHKKQLSEIFEVSNVSKAYSYVDNNILESVKQLYKTAVKSTLLKEHYRCDPHIINFCNKRFYDNQLLVRTKHDDKNGVEIIPTKAHSELDRANERQVCVIEEEVIPNLVFNDIGIIAPYNNQVNLIKRHLKDKGIKVETIHKFQGQENDVIILSTVSDRVKFSDNDEFIDFLNDPKLLNVAISRAKKKLIMIISEELMQQNGAILSDFSRYIKYFSESGQIRESKIYSVFDLMYQDYSRILDPLRAKLLSISEFDSENIIATLIKDCIDKQYKTFDFVHNYPLRKVINSSRLADERDRKFVSNENTHCDFIVYNRFDKKPYFVVEVDGKQHRKKVQQERDARKDRLLNSLGIPVYRIPTTAIVKIGDIEKYFLSTSNLIK